MFSFFLFLLFMFVLVRLLRWFLAVRRLHRNAREQYRRYRRAAGFPPEQPRERPGGWSAPPRKRKIITRDVGEYVKFTEVDAGPAASDPGAQARRDGPAEPQVSDAEWEEIGN